MNPYIVIPAARQTLYPKFGTCSLTTRTVFIRKDLPASVFRFVREHEIYHLDDLAKFWLWREIKANVHAAWKFPYGFIVCFIMSLNPYRLKFYWQRWRKGK